MTPPQIVDLLSGLASTACFLALAVYVFLIWRGPDAKLYAMTNNDEMTKKIRAFLALAGLGFLVCMYRGTESMLFWLPVNITSEGEHITAASVVALIFTMVAGSILIKHILRTPDLGMSLELVRGKASGLQEILECSNSQRQLDALKIAFQERIDTLESGRLYIVGSSDTSPEKRRAESFRYLMHLVDTQKSKLSKSQA